jgi:hypothetical protein
MTPEAFAELCRTRDRALYLLAMLDGRFAGRRSGLPAGPERDDLDRRHLEHTAKLREELAAFERAIAAGPAYGG